MHLRKTFVFILLFRVQRSASTSVTPGRSSLFPPLRIDGIAFSESPRTFVVYWHDNSKYFLRGGELGFDETSLAFTGLRSKLTPTIDRFYKNILNASWPFEHPSVRGKNVNTFRWDHRVQRQNLLMAF